MSLAPATLDRDGIAARVPHHGSMCLLERLEHWSATEILCSATSHTLADNPLRTPSGLLSVTAIEYAAQAMALHGALIAPPGTAARPGYLASVRNVRLTVPRLDRIVGSLQVRAERLAGDARQILYGFAVSDEHGALLVDGRAVVVLDTPLSMEQP